jgi:tryptophanyl-tRNA synthetase
MLMWLYTNKVRATHVPVGEDQAQHLEFTRNCAGSFNHLHGPVFPMPETVICEAFELDITCVNVSSTCKASQVLVETNAEDVQIGS